MHGVQRRDVTLTIVYEGLIKFRNRHPAHKKLSHMKWEVCIQYASGAQRVLHTYHNRESALKCVDKIYAERGYPLHLAYVVRQALAAPALQYAC